MQKIEAKIWSIKKLLKPKYNEIISQILHYFNVSYATVYLVSEAKVIFLEAKVIPFFYGDFKLKLIKVQVRVIAFLKKPINLFIVKKIQVDVSFDEIECLIAIVILQIIFGDHKDRMQKLV